jgi:predicted RNA-binding protein with PIN domain
MIIVIDGYNLLKQIFPGNKHELDRQKMAFIRQLAHYQHKKAASKVQIIVVYDGGLWPHASREVKSGVVIMYSGNKSSADDWIFDYVTRHRGHELLVVTLDRELRERCQRSGADWMSVFEFYTIMQSVVLQDAAEAFALKNLGDQINKIEHDHFESDYENPYAGKALDLLMEQASLKGVKNESEGAARHRNPQKLSKEERRKQIKIRKIS